MSDQVSPRQFWFGQTLTFLAALIAAIGTCVDSCQSSRAIDRNDRNDIGEYLFDLTKVVGELQIVLGHEAEKFQQFANCLNDRKPEDSISICVDKVNALEWEAANDFRKWYNLKQKIRQGKILFQKNNELIKQLQEISQLENTHKKSLDAISDFEKKRFFVEKTSAKLDEYCNHLAKTIENSEFEM